MVKVLFFAQLKELLNCDGLNLNVECPQTVQSIKQAIIAENPNWAEPLNQATIMCAVNQAMVDNQHAVEHGDEVAFFPPVTGG